MTIFYVNVYTCRVDQHPRLPLSRGLIYFLAGPIPFTSSFVSRLILSLVLSSRRSLKISFPSAWHLLVKMSDSQFLKAITTPTCNTSIHESTSQFHLLLVIENQHHLNFCLILAPTGTLEALTSEFVKPSSSLQDARFLIFGKSIARRAIAADPVPGVYVEISTYGIGSSVLRNGGISNAAPRPQ